MNRPTSTREALIVEVLGDVAQLLDRIEALAPAMDAARQGLIQASADLVRQGATFERQVNTLGEAAKIAAIRHVIRRTEALTQQSMDTQSRAMSEAAQKLFVSEVHPALQRLALPLLQLATRLDRPWRPWLMHAATAVSASALTAALALALWGP